MWLPGFHVDTCAGRLVATEREDRSCQVLHSSQVAEDEQHFKLANLFQQACTGGTTPDFTARCDSKHVVHLYEVVFLQKDVCCLTDFLSTDLCLLALSTALYSIYIV